jgi:hypothetical protein
LLSACQQKNGSAKLTPTATSFLTGKKKEKEKELASHIRVFSFDQDYSPQRI